VIGQQPADQRLPVAVQGIQWLVEDPDSGLAQKEARQGEPAPLTGRKADRRRSARVGQPNRRKDGLQGGRIADDSLQCGRDPQVLARGQRQSVTILMADVTSIAGIVAWTRGDVLPTPGDRARLRPQQPRQNPQQAGLARAVGAFHLEQGARQEREG